MCDNFYITHVSVSYEIYPAHFPFDLRCQSGIVHHKQMVPQLIYCFALKGLVVVVAMDLDKQTEVIGYYPRIRDGVC